MKIRIEGNIAAHESATLGFVCMKKRENVDEYRSILME